eukprot:6470145-Amphidinium_carterae.1
MVSPSMTDSTAASKLSMSTPNQELACGTASFVVFAAAGLREAAPSKTHDKCVTPTNMINWHGQGSFLCTMSMKRCTRASKACRADFHKKKQFTYNASSNRAHILIPFLGVGAMVVDVFGFPGLHFWVSSGCCSVVSCHTVGRRNV